MIDNHIKGEFVLIIPPRIIDKGTQDHEPLLSILLSELPLKQAVKLACQITGEQKNVVYKLALDLQAKHRS